MSGWAVATIKGDLEPDITKHIRNYGKGINSDFDIEISNDSLIVRLSGYSAGSILSKMVESCFLDSEIEILAIVEANDTTDAGVATVYKLENRELNTLDIFNGYEGARGYDAAGMVNENYGFFPKVI